MLKTVHVYSGELWGELTGNGSWNGMVGLFARGDGDIGVANIFITALGGRREFQEYTTPYGQEVGFASSFFIYDFLFLFKFKNYKYGFHITMDILSSITVFGHYVFPEVFKQGQPDLAKPGLTRQRLVVR